MFLFECYLQVKLSSCLSPPCLPKPPTATGACEAVKEKAQGKLNTQVSCLQFVPQLCPACDGVFISSSVFAAEEQQERMKGGDKTPTVNAQVSHTHLLCMKPHKHLLPWFIKAQLGSISSSVWSQCWRMPGELWHMGWSCSWGMCCSALQAPRAIQLLTEKATAASHPSKAGKPSVHELGEMCCGSSCLIPFQCRNLVLSRCLNWPSSDQTASDAPSPHPDWKAKGRFL